MSELPFAACVLVMRDGLVLGVARKDNDSDWGLPGGKCEPGENSLDAAKREFFEETGINIASLAIVEIYHADAGGFHAITYLAVSPLSNLVPVQQTGEGRVAWVTWDMLFQGRFAAYNKNLYIEVVSLRERLARQLESAPHGAWDPPPLWVVFESSLREKGDPRPVAAFQTEAELTAFMDGAAHGEGEEIRAVRTAQLYKRSGEDT